MSIRHGPGSRGLVSPPTIDYIAPGKEVRMTMRRLAIGGAILGLFTYVTVASAAPPCLADIQKLCANVPGTAGQIQACLKSHEAALSKECKAHVDGMKKTAGELAATCIWDIERFCSDVPSGGGRLAECLKGNRNDLSPECKAKFSPSSN